MTQSHPSNPYPWQGIEEIARLIEQDDCMNQVFQYPPHSNLLPVVLEPGSRILDLGCGTGGWARAVAQAYPQYYLIGIDEKEMLINYANSKVLTFGLSNVNFLQGDFLAWEEKNLHFLHARFLQWFLPTYEAAVCRWFEMLEPGGYLCLVEGESQITNSRAFNTLLTNLATYMHQIKPNLVGAGISGSMGITLDLHHTLAHAGFENIKEQAFCLNFSAGIKGRDAYVRDICHGLAATERIPHKVEKRELRRLAQECLFDLNDNPEFRGITYHLAVWGRKPS